MASDNSECRRILLILPFVLVACDGVLTRGAAPGSDGGAVVGSDQCMGIDCGNGDCVLAAGKARCDCYAGYYARGLECLDTPPSDATTPSVDSTDPTTHDEPTPTEVHYVTQQGAADEADRTGESWHNAWSVDQFNHGDNWSTDVSDDNKIGPGDTVFFAGTFSSMIAPAGSGTTANYITLDGYEAGNNDMRDYACPQCAKVSRKQLINVYGIHLDGNSHIAVQDFEIEQCNIGISIRNDASYLVIKRNIIHDTLDDGLLLAHSNNTVIGGARGDGNHFYDCGAGTGAADVCSLRADYAVVSYNWLEGGSDKDRGIDGVTLNSFSNNWLIEYNLIESHNDEDPSTPDPYKGTDHRGLDGPGEDGIDVKHQCHNIVVRGNLIRGHYYQTGITVHGRGYNVFVHGNAIADNKVGLAIFTNSNDESTEEPPRNIHVWSNLFFENHAAAVTFQRSPQGGSDPREPHHLFVYNNVLSRNVLDNHPLTTISSVTSATNWRAGDSTYLRDVNNIYYNNRPTQSIRHHEVFTYGDWRAFDSRDSCAHSHNTYFDPGHTSLFRWYNSDGTYTSHDLAWVQANTNLGADSYDRDPGMADPNNHEFWVASSSSSMCNSGVALKDDLLPGRMYFLEDGSVWVDLSYADALSRETDWTTTPPTVKMLNQNEHGSGWERGAHVHVSARDAG